MRTSETLYTAESPIEICETKLSSVLQKLEVYTIMIDGISEFVDLLGQKFCDEKFEEFRSSPKAFEETGFFGVPQVFDADTEAKYVSATKVLDSLVHTPALFESLSEEVRTKYAHHDLFQDFYNKVTSRATLLDDTFKQFSEQKWYFYESQKLFLESERTKEDIDIFQKVYEKFFEKVEEFEEDIIFFRRMKEIWPYYKLIMEALVVRSFNIESGHKDEYFVPEKIKDEQVQRDVQVSDFCADIENFLKVYPKRVFLDDVSVYFDKALEDQKIHISKGVLFNIIRNIIGNIISPEKQEKIFAHNILLGFSLAFDSTGIPFVEITIADDGRGIPQDVIPFIFEEGVSGTESTGLGLAHIDEFIQSMNGRIYVKSELQEKEEIERKKFSFQSLKRRTVTEFLEKKEQMNTIFSLQFPLVL